MIRLSNELNQIQQGAKLPWTVFDGNGRSLLRQGVTIDSPQRLKVLADKGVYRSNESKEYVRSNLDRKSVPFFVIGEWMGRLNTMLNAIAAKDPEFRVGRLYELCNNIQIMCAEDADAALAAVHLERDGKYAIRHLIHSALLVELVTNRMGLLPDDRLPVIAATLTANVGMLDLQEQLMKQEGISSRQREDINRHPERGVELLCAAGVQDELWLDIVLQHHERLDGNGYPLGLRNGEIKEGARIMAIADIYHAKISDRMHRSSILPTDALRQVLLEDGNNIDPALTEVFIKELGVFPPGTFVLLYNGDIGVVAHRGQEGIAPSVASIITPRGVAYPRPLSRDPANREWAIKEIVARDESILLTDILPLWGYS